MTTLMRTPVGWLYHGVEYTLPLPLNSPVSFAVARANTEADGLDGMPISKVKEKANRGGFNNKTRHERKLKCPEFAHLTKEQRNRAMANMYYHQKGNIRKDGYQGGTRPDITPLEILEMYGLPMPPGGG